MRSIHRRAALSSLLGGVALAALAGLSVRAQSNEAAALLGREWRLHDAAPRPLRGRGGRDAVQELNLPHTLKLSRATAGVCAHHTEAEPAFPRGELAM